MRTKKSVQASIIRALEDPIAKTLLKGGHLTKIQLETLLIDVLSDSAAGRRVKYDEKARLRLTKAKISRGAFNRTLNQAKSNVIKAIYTLILLGYLGIFDGTSLDNYLEIANKLDSYMSAYRKVSHDSEDSEEQMKIMEIIRKELEMGLKHLATP